MFEERTTNPTPPWPHPSFSPQRPPPVAMAPPRAINFWDMFIPLILILLMIGILVGGSAPLAMHYLETDENNAAGFLIVMTAGFLCFCGAFVTALLTSLLRGLTLQDLGFRTPSLLWVLAGLIVGIIAVPLRMMLILFIMIFTGIPQAADEGALNGSDALVAIAMLQLLIMVVFLAPLAEELFFRGLLYPWLRRRVGVVVAALVSGFLFGLAHIDPYMVVSNTVLGVMLALCYHYSRSIWVPMLIHFVNNSIAAVLIVLLAVLTLL